SRQVVENDIRRKVMLTDKRRIEVATHAGSLPIGNGFIGCAVLDDGRRVLSQQGLLIAIGRARSAKGGQGASSGTVAVLAAKNLQQFVDDDLRKKLVPIRYKTPTGATAYGILAESLPAICEVFLKARDKNCLVVSQYQIADQCQLLIRGFAAVGIVALVDEASGFQQDRAKDALEQFLRKFISDTLARWVKTFPDEFYRELYRVYGKQYSASSSRRPQFVAVVTNDLVYKRLGPEVLEALQKKNPRVPENGRRKSKHHQWLTDDIGHPRLREHIYALITLLRICADGDRKQFKQLVDRALPKPSPQMKIPGID
ncbi:MAG: P63C domain-containing protein, partial [Chthonomonadales bacterium]